MQISHYAIRAHTLIILTGIYLMPQDWSNFLIEFSLRKALEESTYYNTPYTTLQILSVPLSKV